MERYKLLRKEILKIVETYGSSKTYCSVGHSLGAAMSGRGYKQEQHQFLNKELKSNLVKVMISLELRLKNYSSWAFLLSPPKVGASDFNHLVRTSVPDIWRFIRINDFLPKLSPIPPYHVSRLQKHYWNIFSAFWRQRSNHWSDKLRLANSVGNFDSLTLLLRLKHSSFSIFFHVDSCWCTTYSCNRNVRTGKDYWTAQEIHSFRFVDTSIIMPYLR